MSNEPKTARLMTRACWMVALQVAGIILIYVTFTWVVLHDSILA